MIDGRGGASVDVGDGLESVMTAVPAASRTTVEGCSYVVAQPGRPQDAEEGAHHRRHRQDIYKGTATPETSFSSNTLSSEQSA